MFLDDDDLIFSDHVEVLMEELQADKDIEAAYSLGWDAQTEFLSQDPLSYKEMTFSTEAVFRQPYSRDLLLHHNYIPIQAIIFHRDIYERHGGFDTSMDYLEDWNLWTRYSRQAEFKYVEKTTSLFRTPYDPKIRAERHELLHGAYEVAVAKQSEIVNN